MTEASADEGSAPPPDSAAPAATADGVLQLFLSKRWNRAETPRMVALLAAVAIRSADEAWVDEMLSVFAGGATDGLAPPTEERAAKAKAEGGPMQGDELKAIRKALGWTQAEMGAAMGLTPQAIGTMERGDAPIEKRTKFAALYLRDHPEAGA